MYVHKFTSIKRVEHCNKALKVKKYWTCGIPEVKIVCTQKCRPCSPWVIWVMKYGWVKHYIPTAELLGTEHYLCVLPTITIQITPSALSPFKAGQDSREGRYSSLWPLWWGISARAQGWALGFVTEQEGSQLGLNNPPLPSELNYSNSVLILLNTQAGGRGAEGEQIVYKFKKKSSYTAMKIPFM